MTLWVGIRGTISMIWKSRMAMRKCCLRRIQRLMAILLELVKSPNSLEDVEPAIWSRSGKCCQTFGNKSQDVQPEINRVAFEDYVESLFCGCMSVVADIQ